MASVASLELPKAQKSSQSWRHRIRKGQKLDEVAQVIESRHSGDDASSSSAAASTSASTFNSSSKQPTLASSAASGGESPFQLQEYLAMLVRQDPHNVERIVALPSEADIEAATSFFSPRKGDAEEEASLQPVDTDIWVYEQLRRLVLDLTTPWLTSLQQECDRHVRPETCAAMNAGDWMFLCASHGEEKQCCAIDYMVHTLDGATSLLNSARHFPSRTYVPNTSLRHFGSIARRLSRIFVHAWCYHKDVFSACEAETSLYSRFFALIETFDLTATDNLPPPDGAVLAASSSGAETDGNDFSRGTSLPFAHVNGTTARRDRSSTAAPRTSVVHNLQQLQSGDRVGTVPPPAPSPRPTAILSRPDHEEDDDTPAWTSTTGPDEPVDAEESGLPRNLNAEEEEEEDDDDEDDDDDDDEDDDDDDKAKEGDDDDAEPTILLKNSSVTASDSVESTTSPDAAASSSADSAIDAHAAVKGLEEGLETSAEKLREPVSSIAATSSTAQTDKAEQ